MRLSKNVTTTFFGNTISDIDTTPTVPEQSLHCNVWTGSGVTPLWEYVDAVKPTGYTGWYCSEICRDELDLLDVARTPRGVPEILVR